MNERICVAICSRNRPKMAMSAVRSVLASRLPDQLEVRLLLVENNVVPDLDLNKMEAERSAVAGGGNGIRLFYLLQPRLGIATARNTALDWARAEACDWLAFIDDDEMVDLGWLENLLATAKARRLVLTTGPAIPVAEIRPATVPQRWIWAGYVRQRQRRRNSAARLVGAGKEGHITGVTNNWLLNLRDPSGQGLRFDPRFDLTGGEDSDFFRRLKARGAATGWAEDAVVHETIPPSRVTARYQFRRAFEQSAIRLAEKTKTAGPARAVALIGFRAISSLLIGSFYFILIIPTFGWTFFDAIRHLGAGCGALFAKRSNVAGFYEDVTGA